jgi:hypothetical protein
MQYSAIKWKDGREAACEVFEVDRFVTSCNYYHDKADNHA